MRRVALLTTDRLDDYVTYDHLLEAPLARRGWRTDFVPWREPTDWDAFDAVIIRSTWDYQHDPEAFLTVLQDIDRSSARLENPLALVRWNINKTYLRELEEDGRPVVPTAWLPHLAEEDLAGLFERFETDEVVVKPVIGASAEDTFRLTTGSSSIEAIEAFADRACMVQPFLQEIVDEGEFSLFHFGGEFNHAILKAPARGDFRVQEEHGGHIRAVTPEPALLSLANDIVAGLSPSPLYARSDFVRRDSGFVLMELELVEPSLYFTFDDDSPDRFAEALNKSF